ncbi:MAG: tyrosine-type recombinase/integrase [Planctomycetaceae bacterium]
MSNRTKGKKSGKPYAGFPLFVHPSGGKGGRWCRKARIPQPDGTTKLRWFYFGHVENDPEGKAALEQYQRDWPYLKDGRTPPPVDTRDGVTLGTLCDVFLHTKKARVDSGERSPRSLRDYFRACATLVEHFGAERRIGDLRPHDFRALRSALASRGWSIVTLKNEITRIRAIFEFANDEDEGLVDRPIAYKKALARPEAGLLRKARHDAGSKMFEAEELRRIIDSARQPLKAMVLLAINCGFGNTDVASLPMSALDLDGGWVDFPRPKTHVPRRVPLWGETVDALREALGKRPSAKDRGDFELVFVTQQGRRFVRTQEKIAEHDGQVADLGGSIIPIDALTQRFARLMKRLKLDGGRGFYSIRHAFETIGGESKDQVAVNAIMGHVDASMAGQYRERISDDRLRAVVETVRAWLWPAEGERSERDEARE